jgi:hypothetical protein
MCLLLYIELDLFTKYLRIERQTTNGNQETTSDLLNDDRRARVVNTKQTMNTIPQFYEPVREQSSLFFLLFMLIYVCISNGCTSLVDSQ